MERGVQIGLDHVKTNIGQLLHDLFETGNVTHLPAGIRFEQV